MTGEAVAPRARRHLPGLFGNAFQALGRLGAGAPGEDHTPATILCPRFRLPGHSSRGRYSPKTQLVEWRPRRRRMSYGVTVRPRDHL